MNKINGFDNEYEFVKKLNGRKVNEIDPLLEIVVKDLFPKTCYSSYIKCWRNHYRQKSDIFLKINGIMKGISIKKGSRNSVHVESIYSFTDFLIKNGVDKKSVVDFLKYHYADGTLNGTGTNRISADKYKEENLENIDKLNQIFNSEELIRAAIDRFVIKGVNSEFFIDGIIYGEVDDFLWINRQDIIKAILASKDVYSTAIHFGSLTCQPKNRCLNYNKKYERDRHFIQIKWYSLFDDIIENMNNKIKKVD